jgi:hypothetical protein
MGDSTTPWPNPLKKKKKKLERFGLGGHENDSATPRPAKGVVEPPP